MPRSAKAGLLPIAEYTKFQPIIHDDGSNTKQGRSVGKARSGESAQNTGFLREFCIKRLSFSLLVGRRLLDPHGMSRAMKFHAATRLQTANLRPDV